MQQIKSNLISWEETNDLAFCLSCFYDSQHKVKCAIQVFPPFWGPERSFWKKYQNDDTKGSLEKTISFSTYPPYLIMT